MRSRPWSGMLTVLLLGGASLLVVHLYILFFVPSRINEGPGIVEVPYGASIQETAEILHKNGWVPSASGFVLLARLTDSRGTLKAGEYMFSSSISSWQILKILRKGSVVLHRVTVPEGLRGIDVAGIVSEKLSLSRDRFAELLTDPELIRSLSLEVPSLEGYLLPETYSFPKNATEEQVIRKMAAEMFAFFDSEKMRQAEFLGMDLHQILTLASIIEKEMGVENEGPLISSVYHNRLEKRMRLQSDPTVIYGIRDFDGDLRWKDLKQDTPYNTYLRAGLPPTPIANPGRTSILAALYPSESKYLYFVSRNNRTHAFSQTLAEHNRQVNRYQKGRR